MFSNAREIGLTADFSHGLLEYLGYQFRLSFEYAPLLPSPEIIFTKPISIFSYISNLR
jgi:hypothetical protein